MIWLIPGEEETAESSNDVISDRTAEEQQSESSSLASMSPSQVSLLERYCDVCVEYNIDLI